MTNCVRWLQVMLLVWILAACGGGGGGEGDAGALPTSGPLSGDPSSLALAALQKKLPIPVESPDIVGSVILTRLDVAITANATVAQVNAALNSIGATFSWTDPGFPALTLVVPRQENAAAMRALADRLEAQPGIRSASVSRVASIAIAPPPPADAQGDFGYLQQARFPAAWNARASGAPCTANNKVTVIVMDFYHRPMDPLYAEFAGQVGAITELGEGSLDANDFEGYHGYNVMLTMAAGLDATSPTGANPFKECFDFRALQIHKKPSLEIPSLLAGVLAATNGKVLVNASYAYPERCKPEGSACTAANLDTPTAYERAYWAAVQRSYLRLDEDRALVVSAAGNFANQPITDAYQGAGQARYTSAFNVAATADSAMSFMSNTQLWEPAPCAGESCPPSLVATLTNVAQLAGYLSDINETSVRPASNVLIVGSIDSANARSKFSEPGEHVLAAGEGIPTLLGIPTQGTSFSAPQVTALAAYLWILSPELRARPLSDTIAAIKGNADASGIINAYASVLSLDQTVAVTPQTAKVRLAILDVDDDGDFDLDDLQRFHAAYVAAGRLIGPEVQDHSRFDLNGDGFTGSSQRTAPMDLDPTGSMRFGAPTLSEVQFVLNGITRKVNESAVTDAQAVCYYATSQLYSGADLATRDQLLVDICPIPSPPACPLYKATVNGETKISTHFSTNAEQRLPPAEGAYGSAVIGGNPTMSLTSGYPGSASASADVTYTVEASTAPTTTFDALWKWRTTFNINPGGSCSATLTIGGISQTLSGIDHQPQERPFTTRVRHGDEIKLHLEATCTSPGLVAGTPPVLVNANMGSVMVTPVIPDVRINPVMCNP